MTFFPILYPIAWTAVIASFSGEEWSAEGTGFLIPFLARLLPWADADQLAASLWLARKAAHVVEYAVLGGLWWWALASDRPRWWPAALGLAVLTAAGDELHQATTWTRTGSILDVALDSAGAGAAIAAAQWGSAGVDRITGALLWIAAVAGTALLALNWIAMAPSGWLWLTVPAAWLVLAFRYRRARRP